MSKLPIDTELKISGLDTMAQWTSFMNNAALIAAGLLRKGEHPDTWTKIYDLIFKLEMEK